MHPDRQAHLVQGMWKCLHRVWEATQEADDTNATWATWTWAGGGMPPDGGGCSKQYREMALVVQMDKPPEPGAQQ